jgi:hypothetical protein
MVIIALLLLLLLMFDVFILTSPNLLSFMNKWFVQIYLYVTLLKIQPYGCLLHIILHLESIHNFRNK